MTTPEPTAPAAASTIPGGDEVWVTSVVGGRTYDAELPEEAARIIRYFIDGGTVDGPLVHELGSMLLEVFRRDH